MKYNVYCDESCHLLSDNKRYMVLGCIWCPCEKVRDIHDRIREIRLRNKLPLNGELKWKKICKGNVVAYADLINYFFDDDDIHFRAVIIDKTELQHDKFGQDHDTWYYKMLFTLLKNILNEANTYNIYIDYKDTRSNDKCSKLHKVLCNSKYDFNHRIITKVEPVQSSDVGLIQLCDILIGAIEYSCHEMNTSVNKLSLVEKIRNKSGKSLKSSTLPSEKKFNLFFWHSRNIYD